MRMWNVPPDVMCRQHLLGEHKELHMLVGTIRKGHSLRGYTERGLVDTRLILRRHQEIVQGMKARGYDHKSPLPKFSALPEGTLFTPQQNWAELRRRCGDCRARVAVFKLRKKYPHLWSTKLPPW